MTMPDVKHSNDPASKHPSAQATWQLKANETGVWSSFTCKVMSVQVVGEFSGARCVLEGTNDKDAEAIRLTQQFDDDLVFSVPGFSGIRDIPRLIRPKIEGGDDKTDIKIIIHMVP